MKDVYQMDLEKRIIQLKELAKLAEELGLRLDDLITAIRL